MVSTWVSFHFIVVVQNHVYTITSYSRRSILNGQLVELNAKNDTSRPLTSGRLSSFFVSTLPLTEQAYSKMKKNNNKGVFLAILKKSFSEIQLGKYDVFYQEVLFLEKLLLAPNGITHAISYLKSSIIFLICPHRHIFCGYLEQF